MKLRLIESNLDIIFEKDKEFLKNVFSSMRIGMPNILPLDLFRDDVWKQIVSDVREFIAIYDNISNNISIEDFLIEEGYDNPEETLYEWINDAHSDVYYKAHNSRYEKYANTLSLLITGEPFWW